MLDPTAAYRTAQVNTTSPAGQIVLLYQGAIRFGARHVAFLERGDLESAHAASMRCQDIVGALRGSLDLAASPIAVQLDSLYEFVQRRLVDGNVAKDPGPTSEALEVLRGLLAAWQEIAARPAGAAANPSADPASPVPPRATRVPAALLSGAGR